jgi:hypothetical protein
MVKNVFVAGTAALLVVCSAHVQAIEIDYVPGENNVTITGVTVPEVPGAGTGVKVVFPAKKRDLAEGMVTLGLVYRIQNEMVLHVQYRTYFTENYRKGQVVATLGADWTDLTFVAVDNYTGEFVKEYGDPAKNSDLEAPVVEGFVEGSTELTITGLPEGASIVTSYVSPGRNTFTSWIQDGSWGDQDETVNGVVVTAPPRWSGPPYVLGGEILTIGLDGAEEGDLWTYEATGLGTRYTVPVASHVIGASGDPFISDLTIANAFGVTADGWIRFVEDGVHWQQAPSVDFTVAPGESLSWVDVLQSAFNITRNTKGVLVIGGVPTWSLAVVSRNYVIDSEGNRFGINIPGVSSFNPHTERNIWILPGLQENSEFRSNLILAGALPTASSVEIRLLSGGEVVADGFVRTVPAYGLLQVNRIARAMGVDEIADAYLEITVVEGAVYAALSVVDNSADDAAFQLARPALEVD